MKNLLVLGTDTDAGKTTFSLLWMAAFGKDFAYWKPLETGPSDTEKMRRLVPGARVHEPHARFARPVAPPLAAREEGKVVPPASLLVERTPATEPGTSLLIESFGSPFSPLNDHELQIEFLRRLEALPLLVSSSALGAVGRTLSCVKALAESMPPFAVVLVGPRDDYAETTLARVTGLPVVSLEFPEDWSAVGVAVSASRQMAELQELRDALNPDTGSRNESAPVLLAKDRAWIWHPYTSLGETEAPLPVVGAIDEFLITADGRKLIDAISSWWTIHYGHRDPLLVQAANAALRTIDHVAFAGVTHPWAVELAGMLLSTMPWTGGKVFFSDNGSTAVEVALKMAYQFWCLQGEPGRIRFVGFRNGYHGDTFGAMAVGRDPLFFGRFEPLLFQADILPVDADRLDEHLRKHGAETAALIVEPLVQGAGGMQMHSPEALVRLHEVARSHGVLFIADEVMTGGGRTGTLWAFEQAGIAPDLVCAAKTLTGGMLPLAATLAAPHVVAAFEHPDRSRTFFHGHSFTGHPLACAVAAAHWKRLTTAFPEAPRRMEAFWKERLGPLREVPWVAEVRVRGSIAAVEIAAEGGYLADIGPRLRRACLERGVWLRPLGNVLYALPPFEMSAESLERIAGTMSAAVRSLG